MKKTTFVYEIHILRALACLMIFMVHVTATFAYVNDEAFTGFIHLFNQMSRFGSSIFAMVTGFLLFYLYQKKAFDGKHFLKSRAPKTLIPFFFWTLFYLLLLSMRDGFATTFQWNLDFLYSILILGDGFYHLWFLSVVFQFYLLFPLFRKWLTRLRTWVIACASTLMVNFLVIGVWQAGVVSWLPATFWDKAFMMNWIFYLLFGGFLAFHWDTVKEWTTQHRRLLFLLSILMIVVTLLEYHHVGTLPSYRVANLVGTPLLVCTLIGWYPQISQLSWLVYPLLVIGKYSMGIYLLHPFVLFFGKQMPAFFWSPIMFFLTYSICLLLTLALVKIVQKFPKSRTFMPISKVNIYQRFWDEQHRKSEAREVEQT